MIEQVPFTGTAPVMIAESGKAILVNGSLGYVTVVPAESAAMLADAFGVAAVGANNAGNVSVRPSDAADPVGVGRAIRAVFPAQSCSPGDRYKGDTPGTAALAGQLRPSGGSVASVRAFRSGVRRAKLRYGVKVPAGFDWRMGGKLPGLSSISTSASGGGHVSAGLESFTARLMWKAGGRLDSYFYNNQTRLAGAEYGQSFNNLPDVFLQTGWNTIEQEISLNTAGVANGFCRCSLNGSDFINRSDVDWVGASSLQIGGVWFCTFFGGSTELDGDDTWETLVDTHLEFSDLYVESDF